MSVLTTCMSCTMCMPGDRRGQKSSSNPLKLELWMVVSYHVNPSPVLYKGNKYSQPQSHLSRPNQRLKWVLITKWWLATAIGLCFLYSLHDAFRVLIVCSIRRKFLFFSFFLFTPGSFAMCMCGSALCDSVMLPKAPQETRLGSILRQGHWHSVYWSWALGWNLLTWGHHDKILQLSCLSGDTYWISENSEKG